MCEHVGPAFCNSARQDDNTHTFHVAPGTPVCFFTHAPLHHFTVASSSKNIQAGRRLDVCCVVYRFQLSICACPEDLPRFFSRMYKETICVLLFPPSCINVLTSQSKHVFPPIPKHHQPSSLNTVPISLGCRSCRFFRGTQDKL